MSCCANWALTVSVFRSIDGIFFADCAVIRVSFRDFSVVDYAMISVSFRDFSVADWFWRSNTGISP